MRTRTTRLVAVFALFALLLVARPASAEPSRVTVGVYVAQILNIDLKSNTFTIDFWLWFRSAPRPTPSIDTFELVDAQITARTNVVKKLLPDGQEYSSARIIATVHRQWDLHRYPFDDHDLEIMIEDSEQDITGLIWVPDPGSQAKDAEAFVAGWDLGELDSRVTERRYPSNYGDTSLTPNADTRFSRFTARIPAYRRGSARFLKITFPLLLSVLIAWCAFFIRPKDAAPRVSVSVGALFAGAAGTIAINSQLPDINYSTVADKTVFLSLGMITVSLLATVAALTLHYLGREKTHRRVDIAGSVAFPVVFAVLLKWIVS